MGAKRKKKGESGEATKYITRNAAVKKLQLSLKDFRRLCILKGIYPREPNHRRKAQKGDSRIKTLFLVKDIRYLLHEPIIWKFRELRTFLIKTSKAKARKERDKVENLYKNPPFYRLDHIVQERYPTFVDALQDLDDPLTLCVLFSKMARTWRIQDVMLHICRRLTVEFMHYVIETQGLRKAFISVKGYYYQVEVMGQTITWIAPHPFTPLPTTDVDLRVMTVFLDFYITLLGFVNFRLYHSLNIHYPPKLQGMKRGEEEEEASESSIVSGRVASLNIPLQRNKVDDNDEEGGIDMHLLEEDEDKLKAAREEQQKKKKQQSLFKGLKFFLNRETNLESLTFVIRSCMGEVSWQSSTAEGSTFLETDEAITHQIVDRPMHQQNYLSRYYIQPQWVYDCVNARLLLPVQDYFPGVNLPAHLSPFEKENDLYIPPEKKLLMARQKGEVPIDLPQKMEDSDEDNEKEVYDWKKMKRLKTKEFKAKKRAMKEKEMENEKVNKPMEEGKETEEVSKPMEEGKETEEVSKPMEEGKETGEVSKPMEEGKETGKVSKEVSKPAKIPLRKKMRVIRGNVAQPKPAVIESQEREEKMLAVMMIPKKKKRLYKILNRKEKRQTAKVKRLTEKRNLLEEQKKKDKANKLAGSVPEK
ncbi:pescadillo-like [Homarus americanus]|uniref:pescadillo-like n=1 Tax=Homarus americanus TaxID=6706 RepID=UPI001C492A60|nr:pescadillo-like [Homarus americanus]